MAAENPQGTGTAGTDLRRVTTATDGDAQGRTVIADHVVAKISGMAARQVRGVHRMGGNASRAFDAVRERIPGSTSSAAADRGVAVEVGERQAAVDINLVVEYGAVIPDLAAEVLDPLLAETVRKPGAHAAPVPA